MIELSEILSVDVTGLIHKSSPYGVIIGIRADSSEVTADDIMNDLVQPNAMYFRVLGAGMLQYYTFPKEIEY